MCCYVSLGLNMYVLGSIKTRGAAGADTIVSQDLDSFFLESLIRDKVVEVVGGEIGHSAAIG